MSTEAHTESVCSTI